MEPIDALSTAGRASLAQLQAVLATVERRNSGQNAAALLDEAAPYYQGLGTADAEIVRSHCMVALALAGFADEILDYALEDLATAERAWPLAAAARAITLSHAASTVVPLLAEALERVVDSSEPIRLPGDFEPTTAPLEIVRRLRSLGPEGDAAITAWLEGSSAWLASGRLRAEASSGAPAVAPAPLCCGRAKRPPTPNIALGALSPDKGPALSLSLGGPARECALEDQDGCESTLSDLFADGPAVIAFFYTRCMNPRMCSATVERLGQLSRRLAVSRRAAAATVAGISYDPAYDGPERLRGYGERRDVQFGPCVKLMRTKGPLDPLLTSFGLGVGYGPVTVNRHRLELYVLGLGGAPVIPFERRAWSVDGVLAAIAPLLSDNGAAVGHHGRADRIISTGTISTGTASHSGPSFAPARAGRRDG